MSEIRPAVSLDHVQLVAMWMRFLIEPHFVHEVHAINDQRVAFPMTDGVSVPEQIRVLGMRPSEINMVEAGTVIVRHFDQRRLRLDKFDQRPTPEYGRWQ